MLLAQHAGRALLRCSPAAHRRQQPAHASLYQARVRPAAATVRCCLRAASSPAATTRRCRTSQPAHLPLPLPPRRCRSSQHHGTRSSVATSAVQLEVVMASLASFPWAAAAVLVGIALGLGLAKFGEQWLSQQTDPYQATLENAELREKVEDLQQLVVKLQPLAYKGIRMRFTKGVNKAVILGMVDKMLENKEVNLWWLPDAIERVLYFNMMGLMLAVLDETVASMSINFAGHNVKLQLTYLDVAPEGAPDDPQTRKTQALLDRALEPLPPRAAGSTA